MQIIDWLTPILSRVLTSLKTRREVVVGLLVGLALVVSFALLLGRNTPDELLLILSHATSATQQVQSSVADLDSELDNLNARVTELTTTEIASKIDRLENKLNNLQSIISPTNASEILNVARMSEEILQREGFEKRVEKWMMDNDKTVDTLQAFVWSALILIIGGLMGLLFFFMRRTLPRPAPHSLLKAAPADNSSETDEE